MTRKLAFAFAAAFALAAPLLFGALEVLAQGGSGNVQIMMQHAQASQCAAAMKDQEDAEEEKLRAEMIEAEIAYYKSSQARDQILKEISALRCQDYITTSMDPKILARMPAKCKDLYSELGTAAQSVLYWTPKVEITTLKYNVYAQQHGIAKKQRAAKVQAACAKVPVPDQPPNMDFSYRAITQALPPNPMYVDPTVMNSTPEPDFSDPRRLPPTGRPDREPTPKPAPAPPPPPATSALQLTIELGTAKQAKDLKTGAAPTPPTGSPGATVRLQSGPTKYQGDVKVTGTLPADYTVYVFHHSQIWKVLGPSGGEFEVGESKGFGAANDVEAMACKAGFQKGAKEVPAPCLGGQQPLINIQWIP